MANLLTDEQCRALHILAYLMLRMGQWERARHIYATLVSIEDSTSPDTLAHAGLSAIAIQNEDGAGALAHLHIAMQDGVFSTRRSALYLMKAQGLWLEGRKDAAREAVQEYLYIAGHKA